MYRTILRDQTQVGRMHRIGGNVAVARADRDVIAVHALDANVSLARHLQIGLSRHLDQAINERVQFIGAQRVLGVDRNGLVVDFHGRLEVGDRVGDFRRRLSGDIAWLQCYATQIAIRAVDNVVRSNDQMEIGRNFDV